MSSFDFHHLTEQLERRSSRRIALRPVAYCDAWPLFQATRLPRFNEHLTWPQPQHESEAEARVDAILKASRRGLLSAVSAVARDSGDWISLYRLQPSGRGVNSLEVGVWTHPSYWHGRYSPELMAMCIDTAFETTDAEEIVGAGAVENRGSLGLMRIVGMKPAREFTKPTEHGVMLPAIEYRQTRAEWLEMKGRQSARRQRIAPVETVQEAALLEAA